MDDDLNPPPVDDALADYAPADVGGDDWSMFPDAPEYSDWNAAIDAQSAAPAVGAPSFAPISPSPDGQDLWAAFPDAPEYRDWNAAIAARNAGASEPNGASQTFAPLSPAPDGGGSWTGGFGGRPGGMPGSTDHDGRLGPPADAPRIAQPGANPAAPSFGPNWFAHTAAGIFAPSGAADGESSAGPPTLDGRTGLIGSFGGEGDVDSVADAVNPPQPSLRTASGASKASAPPPADPWVARALGPDAPWVPPIFTGRGVPPGPKAFTAPSVDQTKVNPNGPGLPGGSKAVLSDNQVAKIIFNEIGAFTGDGFDDAARLNAHAIMNGDERYGDKRPKSASFEIHRKLSGSEPQVLAQIQRDVALARAERAQGIDPTNGATHFNQNSDSTDWKFAHPFQGAMPTTLVELENAHHRPGFKDRVNAYTYADKDGLRFDPRNPNFPTPPRYAPPSQ